MRILISNDDGISAPGIVALAKVAQELGDVYVVAPDRQRSASSHGMSLHHTLYVDTVDFPVSGVEAFSVTGTPVDCVKWGIYHYSQQSVSFDVMLSGINAGYNLATDVLYSGTVAAAGEASLQGIPAIALSLGGASQFDFDSAAKSFRNIANELLRISLPADTFLSVNFPAEMPAGNVWRATQLGARSFQDEFIPVTDDAGRIGYRYGGEALTEVEASDTDTACVRAGDISVSPLRYRFTNTEFLDSLKLKISSVLK
ncbi:5'/3'-nucleotidase SurE [Alicyclobacillus sp. SO9]|uniref:5'/3'-nucleotidase SurE n=1 Tax=Alicyclobacillus sp. SO9 TaxID=2665646 RepID=UPI0018E7E064|nr:5'/3'-nucleotidase SurE [Alicyclobacillus sp. SO9]QQE76772.1 5'/3'-nucleotidase SurE [Alicyclobacillus sp. SO9]